MSLKRSWKLIVLGVAIYLAGLLINLPAASAYAWLAPLRADAPVPISARGLSGTLWNGRAAQLTLGGVPLGQVNWSLAPAALLTGRLAVDWTARKGDAYLSGRAAVIPWGSTRFSGVEGRLPVAELTRFAPPIPLALDGMVSLRLDMLALREGKVTGAAGVLAWQGAKVIAPRPLRLGDLKLELAPDQGGGIAGRLSDAGGPLRAEGDLPLSPDGAYRFQGHLASRDPQQPALAESLAVLGPKSPEGGVRVSLSGRL
jgi:general secretion pathway protein N